MRRIVILSSPKKNAAHKARTEQIIAVLSNHYEIEPVSLLDWDTYKQSGRASHAILWGTDHESIEAILEIGSSQLTLYTDERVFESCLEYPRWTSNWLRSIRLPLDAWDRSNKRKLARSVKTLIVQNERQASQIRKLTGHARIFVLPPSIPESYVLPLSSLARTTGLVCPLIPNRPQEHQSVRWFIRRVLPCLKRSESNSSAFLTLSFQDSVPDWAKDLPGIKAINGSTPLSEILENCRAVVLPFRNTNPLESQILRLMASGRPIVTTGIGAVGLKVSPSQDLFIADRPDAFASCIQKLLIDEHLAEKTAQHAHQTVQKFYLHSVVQKSVSGLVTHD